MVSKIIEISEYIAIFLYGFQVFMMLVFVPLAFFCTFYIAFNVVLKFHLSLLVVSSKYICLENNMECTFEVLSLYSQVQSK